MFASVKVGSLAWPSLVCEVVSSLLLKFCVGLSACDVSSVCPCVLVS